MSDVPMVALRTFMDQRKGDEFSATEPRARELETRGLAARRQGEVEPQGAGKDGAAPLAKAGKSRKPRRAGGRRGAAAPQS